MYLHVSLDLLIIFSLIFLFLLGKFTWSDPERRKAMKKLFNKAKAGLRDEKEFENTEPAQFSAVRPPTLADVIRYRYHHGTNIGSIFIMERWLTPSTYHVSLPSGLPLPEARLAKPTGLGERI